MILNFQLLTNKYLGKGFDLSDILIKEPPSDEVKKNWFNPTAEFDHKVKMGHKQDLDNIEDFGTKHWASEDGGKLAAILICDQFSRQIYRKSPMAFAFDPLALELTQDMIAKDEIKNYPIHQRIFVAMPLMHSENTKHTESLIELADGWLKFAEMNNTGEEGEIQQFLFYAQKHLDILKEFGRYPHRNNALHRESTADEIKYLETADTFGQ